MNLEAMIESVGALLDRAATSSAAEAARLYRAAYPMGLVIARHEPDPAAQASFFAVVARMAAGAGDLHVAASIAEEGLIACQDADSRWLSLIREAQREALEHINRGEE